MKTKISQWGNSLGIRIPKYLAEQLHLKDDSPVDVTTQDDKIIISPRHTQATELSRLLDQITPENMPHEIDWGPDVGKEILPPWDGPLPKSIRNFQKKRSS